LLPALAPFLCGKRENGSTFKGGDPERVCAGPHIPEQSSFDQSMMLACYVSFIRCFQFGVGPRRRKIDDQGPRLWAEMTMIKTTNFREGGTAGTSRLR
jgi:hypothetical protein